MTLGRHDCTLEERSGHSENKLRLSEASKTITAFGSLVIRPEISSSRANRWESMDCRNGAHLVTAVLGHSFLEQGTSHCIMYGIDRYMMPSPHLHQN
jgi:hypothetical protein